MAAWPSPTFLDLPDLRMAVYEQGPKDGLPIVLCHGWPELAFSWRHQMAPLAAAGLRVIAPDQRGYGLTGPALNDRGTAADVPLYDMAHLCGDLVHLLDALELEQAIFVGHDWGGLVIWQLPFYHSERVRGLIGVNTPFIPRLASDPIAAMRENLGENMYIVAFQDYGAAEKVLEADIARTLRFLYRRSRAAPDGARPPPADKRWENFALLELLQTDESGWPGEPLLSESEFRIYEDAFRRTGFRGGINWYRNMSRNWQASESFPAHIAQPSLMISAADDRVLSPEMAKGMDKYVPNLEAHVIADCGHWTQAEQPDALNRLMLDWVKRRFMASAV